jgi:hypothetical protein
MGFEQVIYKMINLDTGERLTLETDPKNWDESERSFKRSVKTFGVVTTLSKNLEFTLEGADFLNRAYFLRNIEANVTLEEWKINPRTEVEYKHSSGTFDFSNWDYTKTGTKIPFKSGGLNAIVKSHSKQEFEIDRTTSVNGDIIDQIDIITAALVSREILLITELSTDPIDASSVSFRMNYSSANVRYASLGVPLKVTADSDQLISDVIRDISYNAWGGSTPDTGLDGGMFYYLNDVDKVFESIIIKHSCRVEEIKVDDLRDINDSTPKFLVLVLAKYMNGVSLDIKDRSQVLGSIDLNNPDGFLLNIDVVLEEVELLNGESLALEWYAGAKFGTGIGGDGDLKVNFHDTITNVTVTENSNRVDSQSQAVFFHELGDKLMEIITGRKGAFYSSFYGRTDLGYTSNGEFSTVALALGLWIRQFTDKKLSLSLGDFLKTSNVLHNTGYTIDKIDGEEALIVEDMKFFFQNQVAIILPNQVNKVHRRSAIEFSHASLSFGFEKGGDYEEAMGLDEYNLITNYSEPITRVDTEYTKLSPARADGYAKEFARRKPKFSYGQTDTRYDDDLHVIDLIQRYGAGYGERIWSDDFSAQPKNIFSPDTATNLRHTPYRMSARHEWFYSAGLQSFKDKSIRFASSKAKNDLITQKTGEVERAEKGDKPIIELQKALFENQWIEFEYEVDFDVNAALTGFTEVGGRLIPNYFFKVQFFNEFNQKEYGYIFDVKPDKQGKWKLLKAI